MNKCCVDTIIKYNIMKFLLFLFKLNLYKFKKIIIDSKYKILKEINYSEVNIGLVKAAYRVDENCLYFGVSYRRKNNKIKNFIKINYSIIKTFYFLFEINKKYKINYFEKFVNIVYTTDKTFFIILFPVYYNKYSNEEINLFIKENKIFTKNRLFSLVKNY